MPEALSEQSTGGEQEQRFRTVAVRVEDTVHAQLSFIADLAGTSLSEEVRRAIEGRIASAQEDPALIERAQQAREQIEREAAARAAAIAGFMGKPIVAQVTPAKPGSTGRRATKPSSKQGS
ncbi:MAG: hypothetical protein QM572_07270 [Nocardioides sp.]|uniref:hypothetical protein n=1 Tax=Nocardioides sp. TaxID=35761 RepID=UPI0039E55071